MGVEIDGDDVSTGEDELRHRPLENRRRGVDDQQAEKGERGIPSFKAPGYRPATTREETPEAVQAEDPEREADDLADGEEGERVEDRREGTEHRVPEAALETSIGDRAARHGIANRLERKRDAGDDEERQRDGNPGESVARFGARHEQLGWDAER